MKFAAARRYALALPGTTEAPHHTYGSFRVNGSIYATVPPGEEVLHLFVPDDVREAALAMDPGFVEPLTWGGKVVGLRVRLAPAPAATVQALLRQAHAHKSKKAAGKKVVKVVQARTAQKPVAAARAADANEPTYFDTAADFRRWLDAHGATADALLVGYRKVATGQPGMGWSESVDAALCVGWIDGVRRRVDDARYTIRFTPRRPGSIWSAINIAKFERLREEGRVTAAGERAYAGRQAHRSGIYAYEQAATAELSAGELQAFRRETAAWAYFEAAPPGYRKVILHWVTTAKQPATRARRLAQLVEACAEGRRLR